MGPPISLTAVFLVCGLLLNSSAHAQRQCRGASFSRHFDKRFECGIFKTLTVNPFECHKKCAETLNCFSMNTYNDDKGKEVCELIRKSKKSIGNANCLVDKPGSEHNELEVRTSVYQELSRYFEVALVLGRVFRTHCIVGLFGKTPHFCFCFNFSFLFLTECTNLLTETKRV